MHPDLSFVICITGFIAFMAWIMWLGYDRSQPKPHQLNPLDCFYLLAILWDCCVLGAILWIAYHFATRYW